MLKQPRRLYSFEELKEQVQRLRDKYNRLLDTSEQRAHCKGLITLCTSLAMVFLQEGLTYEAECFLCTATAADTDLATYGGFTDKVWQGRPLPYLLSSYLSLKVSKFQDSLASVYKAQDLCLSIKDSLGTVSADFQLAANLLTFLALWTINQVSDSQAYIQAAAEVIASLNPNTSKLSATSLKNVSGLVAMCQAATKLRLTGDLKQATGICEAALTALKGEDLLVRPLLQEFQQSLRVQSDSLLTSRFEKLLFLSLFVPFIAPNTPLVSFSEPKRETPALFPKRQVTPSVGQRFMPVPRAIDLVRHKKVKSLRVNHGKEKHWWERPGFIDNALSSRNSPQPVRKRSVSRARPNDYTHLIRVPRLHPHLSGGRRASLGQHILLELSTPDTQGSSSFPIEMRPLLPKRHLK